MQSTTKENEIPDCVNLAQSPGNVNQFQRPSRFVVATFIGSGRNGDMLRGEIPI